MDATTPVITPGKTLTHWNTATDFDGFTVRPKFSLGTLVHTRDGRRFRFAKVGAVDLVAGNMLQAPAPIANHQQMAVQAAAAIGAKTVSVTLGSTLATANQYADGVLIITTTPGNGYAYSIKSHPAANSGATLTLTLADDDPLLVALTTSSVASLVANPYSGVIQSPVTTLTGAIVGMAYVPAVASSFCWIQTGGIAAPLTVGTPAVGASVSCPTTSAGALAINSGTLPIVGRMAVVGVDGLNCPVMLLID